MLPWDNLDFFWAFKYCNAFNQLNLLLTCFFYNMYVVSIIIEILEYFQTKCNLFATILLLFLLLFNSPEKNKMIEE